MPIHTSPKYQRDAKLFDKWAEISDATFSGIGMTREQVQKVQQDLQGMIVLPTEKIYQTERMLTNPVFNYYPRAIIYCESEQDVAVAMAFAQLVADGSFQIRAGGHCTAGFSSGPGILIDIKALDNCLIAPDGSVVNVGPGLNFGALNANLAARGLHVPAGECEGVCVGGYVQGGGYGFTSVSFGMNCDNVRSMRVMLADGSVVTASATVNTDLFWALRGGTGGNFGVVLNVEYELRKLGDCLGFAVTWPLTDDTTIGTAAKVMMMLQTEYMAGSRYAPEMNLQVSLCYQTEVDANGQPISNGPTLPYLMVRGLWTGDIGAGHDAIAPIQKFAGGIPQWVLQANFNTLNQKLLTVPQSMPFLTGLKGDAMPYEDKTSRYISQELQVDDWLKILKFFVTSPTNRAYGYFEFYGGKIAEGPDVPNCFIHRDVLYNLTMDVYWMDINDRDTLENWLTDWKALLEPYWNLGIYQNYPNITAPDYDVNYWGVARFALSAVKRKYDPSNVFRFRQQVPMSYELEEEIDPELQAWIDAPITYDMQT